MPDEKLGTVLHQAEAMRPSGSAISGLDPVFENAMKSGHFDVKAFQAAMSGLTPEQRQRVARSFAGPRNVVAMGALMGDSTPSTTSAPMMPTPTNAVEQSRVAVEQAQAQTSASNPSDPGAAWYSEAMKQEETEMTRHPERYPWGTDPNSFWGKRWVGYIGQYGTNKEEVYGANVLGKRFIELARLANDVDSGKVPATKEQRERLQQSLDMLKTRIGESEVINPNANLEGLAKGQYDYGDLHGNRSNILSGLKTDDDVAKFLFDQINYRAVESNVLDDRSVGKDIDDANALERELRKPTGPTPAPPAASPQKSGPVSVNYHIRQTNYGYSYDSLGAPQQYDNNYG
jgi:hypothetical protein